MEIQIDAHELTDFLKRMSDKEHLETAIMTVTQNIAREVHRALLLRTPIDTGNLRAGWSAGDNLMFRVEKTGDSGCYVTLINTARNDKGHIYGSDLNDGHLSFNQYGGPYGWVVGRFFVEKSIDTSYNRVEALVYKELNKWMEWCVSGN